MKFRRKSRRGATEINLTPLLDMVFNLLIFFLVTTTFVQNPGIDVDLPKAKSMASETPLEHVNVALTKDGVLIYEGQTISREDLVSKLRAHHEKSSGKHPTMIVQADAATPHGRVVELMDLARAEGFEKLAIATEEAAP